MALPADGGAASQARSAVRQRLGSVVEPDALQDVMLVVSELVANAFVHGHGDIGLLLAFDGEHVAGTVTDRDPEFSSTVSKWTAGNPLLV